MVERQELLRFADSRVTYQHSEERILVRARIFRDGRAAWGTTSNLQPAALLALRERLEMIVGALPRNGTLNLAGASQAASAATYFESTASATAHARASLFRDALGMLPSGATLGGSIAHGVVEHSVANTNG